MNYSDLLHPSINGTTCSYVDPDQTLATPTESALQEEEEELDSLMLACSQQYEDQQEQYEESLHDHGLIHLLKALSQKSNQDDVLLHLNLKVTLPTQKECNTG